MNPPFALFYHTTAEPFRRSTCLMPVTREDSFATLSWTVGTGPPQAIHNSKTQ